MDDLIFEFVEEVKLAKGLSAIEARDMQYTLAEEIKINNVKMQNATLFFGKLKSLLVTDDKSIFTQNGINIDGIKTVVEKAAKNIEKDLDDKKKEEIKVENEKEKAYQNIAEENKKDSEKAVDNLESTPVPDFNSKYGANIMMTQKEWDNMRALASEVAEDPTKLTEEQKNQEAEMLALENSFYDYFEECLLSDPNMSEKEIQESFFKDKKNLTPEMRAKIEKISVALAQDLIAVAANYIKNRENDGPLTEEELSKISDEIKQKHPTLSRGYGQNLSKMFRKAFDETKAVIENNPDCLNGEINRKTVLNFFRDAIGKVYSFGKEIDRMNKKVSIDRKEKEEESTHALYTQDVANYKRLKEEGTDAKAILEALKQVERKREKIITLGRDVDETLEQDSKILVTDRTAEKNFIRKKAADNRKVIIDNVINEFINSDKNLIDIFNEIPEEVRKTNQLLFKDLIKGLYNNKEYIIAPDSVSAILAGNEIKIQECYQKISVCQEVIENLIKQDPEKNKGEIKRLTNEIKKLSGEITIARLTVKENKEQCKNSKQYKDFKDKFDKNYSEDYIGKYEDVLALGDKDRANKVHEMVNDRNGILILSKNANIDLSEAAKKYFESSPEKLDKYSKKMQAVILGVDENASFDMKKLESIIGYHNKIVMNRTKRIMDNSEKNANRFIKTSAQVENQVKYKRNYLNNKEKLIKCENLEVALGPNGKEYEKQRQNNIKNAVDLYFASNDMSVLDISKKLEDEGITNIPTSELLSNIEKVAEERKPGSSKEIVENEKKIIDYDIHETVLKEMIEKSEFFVEFGKQWTSEAVNYARKIDLLKQNSNQLKEDFVIKSNPVESVDKDERESNPLNLITFLEKKGVTTEAIAEQANIAREAGRELLQEESLDNKTTKSEEAR